MKQEYKDLMMKFLDANPGLEISSNPIGWWRDRTVVGNTTLDNRDLVSDSIAHGEIENAMVALYVKDKTPSCTSYKFVYDNDEKTFIGKVKKKDNLDRFVDVQVRVPEHVWFNTVNFVIDVNGKSSVECDAQFNIRNGIIPKDMEDVRKQIENSICRQFREQLAGKGRVSKERHRRTVNYSDVLEMEFKCNMIMYDNQDFTIKL